MLNAITIPHALIIEGNNATIDCDNGFTADSKLTSIDGTTFQNINFNINQKNKINGRGIELININNVKIINCSFENGHSGIYTGTCSNITVIGCSFMGTTDIKTIGKKKKVPKE